MQNVFNFVHNYRVTPHFSGDEMGKNLLLYVGRHGTCLKIVYLFVESDVYIFEVCNHLPLCAMRVFLI
jgi:hypothetical protein